MPKHSFDAGYILARRDIRNTSQGGSVEILFFVMLALSGAVGFMFQDVRIFVALFLGGLVMWIVQTIYARGKQASEPRKEEGPLAQQAAVPPKPSTLPSPAATLALIKARRSVFPKDYNGAKLSRQQLEMLLEASNWAPTHNLTQPWRFVVLEGSSKIGFEQLTIELVGKYTKPQETAAAAVQRLREKAVKAWPLTSHYMAIILAPVPSKTGKINPEWEDLASVACAVQNIALQATAMGIAGYWSSWQAVARDTQEMREFLGLTGPKDRCLGIYCLGTSDRMGGYRGSRGPIQEKVEWQS